MSGHVEQASGAGFWRGIFVAFVLSALGALGHQILRHEGAISAMEVKLEIIGRTLERMEAKLDELRGKK